MLFHHTLSVHLTLNLARLSLKSVSSRELNSILSFYFDMAASEKSSDPSADSPPSGADAVSKKNPEKPSEDELSEEDHALKEMLDLLVARAMDSDSGVQKLALESIRNEIRSATSSMTSVPKPLKFLRPHFSTLKTYYANSMPDGPNRVFLADILSVLSMTMGDSSQCESLRFKLRGTAEAPHLWGHEYVRHLAGEIAQEYRTIIETKDMRDDDEPEADETSGSSFLKPATLSEISSLVREIVPFLISSNAEPEAVDLLMEVDSLSELVSHTDSHNFSRVCLYLKACADYIVEQEDIDQLLKITADIYVKVRKLPEALQVALRKNDMDMINNIYGLSDMDSTVRLQMAFDLARAGILLDEDIESDENLRGVMSNRKLSAQFLALAKDLDVLEPKTPEDIYKTHLLDSRAPSSSNGDSARANLAKTFVNALVNMGFGTDKLMSDTETGWIYRNKEHGMMSAVASVGMISLWDVDAGLDDIDKYQYAEQEHVRAGAMLGMGLVSANVRHEVEPVLGMLQDQVMAESVSVRIGAIAGLGIAYAGTQKEDLKELLLPILVDAEVSADVVSVTALSLGLTFIGSADEGLSMALLEAMADRKATGESTREPLVQILLPLAFGFLFLGRQDNVEVVEQSIDAMVGNNTLMGRVASATLLACAHCGSGHVVYIQKFLGICGEHPSYEPEEGVGGTAATTSTENSGPERSSSRHDGQSNGSDAENGSSSSGSDEDANNDANNDSLSSEEKKQLATAEQAVAVLGLAMIAMGEDLGSEMSVRTFGHLLQYGDPVIRRVVPLAVGLLSVSDPKLTLMDMLSKFTHDSDMDVAQSAVIGLGLIGAGTNNSRIAGMLRQLSVYYSKEPSCLFLIRISQGLLHAGKGLVTMNVFYADKFLQNKTAIGGLLTVLFCCLDLKSTILGKYHFFLYYLGLAARPRMIYTVDETVEFKATSVRVGQAVDTVGQAGRPKSITGFQTHTTPVLLATGERGEMATDEYLTVAASLEGIVVVEKNPNWDGESGLSEAAARMEKSQSEIGRSSDMTDTGDGNMGSDGASKSGT